ncbi:MAG TPA: molybdopterin-dependent oxidoreductase [Acidimicrobiales bacterium]|nr:molybdopterin-dependent oxidoreductase [Acidimicrobiales bacterium]
MSEATGQEVGRQGAPPPRSEPRQEPTVHVGRRTVLGILGLAGVGIVAGAKIDSAVGGGLSAISNSLGVPLPGADQFRFYTITGTYPAIDRETYKLTVNGMVDHPLSLGLADLQALPRTKLVKRFQCVTGWFVPDVHWEGVLLSDVLAAAGVKPEATALRFFSADGEYTESLTIPQAHRSDVLVADHMLGASVTADHGGPVRLYVAPMYGYKSIKWLDRIEVTNEVVPGFWEDNGYPVDAWIGGTAP